MRTSRTMATLGVAALGLVIGVCPVRGGDEEPADPTRGQWEEKGADHVGEEPHEEPADPTRGQWDSFLDGFRDVEDYMADVQKQIENANKIHVGAAYVHAYQWNFNEPSTGINTLRSLDPDHNSGDPNIGQLSLFRPSEKWIPGFGLKLLGGRVAKRVKADWNGNGAVAVGDTFEKNSFDVQEAYLQYTLADTGTPLDGLQVKGGKFVTTAGAEVIEPWLNYNFSRSFLFGLAIPFTHTGALVTYPVTDKLSITAGVLAGWDNVDDNNHNPSYLGNAVWTICDQVSLAATGIYGPEQTNSVGRKRALGDVVLTVKPVDRLTLLLNYDYAQEDDAALNGGTTKWQGFAAVGNYDFTDRFSVALRGEWFEDAGGARTGTSQHLYEGTATAKYKITQHLYGQLEVRRDEGNKNVFLEDSSEFEGGQTTIGFAVGWVFG